MKRKKQTVKVYSMEYETKYSAFLVIKPNNKFFSIFPSKAKIFVLVKIAEFVRFIPMDELGDDLNGFEVILFSTKQQAVDYTANLYCAFNALAEHSNLDHNLLPPTCAEDFSHLAMRLEKEKIRFSNN